MKEKKYVTREMTPEEIMICKSKSRYATTKISKSMLDALVRQYATRGFNLLYAIGDKRRNVEFMNKQADGNIPFDQEFVIEMLQNIEDRTYEMLEPLFDEFIQNMFVPVPGIMTPASMTKAISCMRNNTKKAINRLKERAKHEEKD